jgi:hypothetical protein
MKNKNELHIIEKKYSLNNLKANELFAWPILRQRVYFEIFKKKFNFNVKLRTRSKSQLIKNAFFGLKYLFKLKPYDFLFFNNADKRTLKKDNKQYDVFFDAWADKVGQEKSLFIEWAIDKHFTKKETYSKNVISDLVFKSFSNLDFTFSAFGIIVNSKVEFNGMAGKFSEPITMIGASKYSKQCSCK